VGEALPPVPTFEEIVVWMRDACAERIAAGEDPRKETRDRNEAFVDLAIATGRAKTKKQARKLRREVFQ
jgi:hypothetical protein